MWWSLRYDSGIGKEFFKLDTSHTEAIKQLNVTGNSLFSAGEYILNCYESGGSGIADKFFYTSKDKINDLRIMPVLSSTALNPVIGCGDSAIRVLNDNEMVYGKTLDSICTALSIIDHMSLD